MTSAQRFVLLNVANFQTTGPHIMLRAANQLSFATTTQIQHTVQIPGTQEQHLLPLRLNLRHKNAFGKEKYVLPLSPVCRYSSIRSKRKLGACEVWSPPLLPQLATQKNLSNCGFLCLIFFSSSIYEVDFSRFCGKKNIAARNKLSWEWKHMGAE